MIVMKIRPWLLANHERVRSHAEPLINKLVYCSDRLDCTGGIYPFGDTHQLRKMAWIFEPYRNARQEGRLSKMGDSEMRAIFEAVMSRITDYSLGESKIIHLEGSFKVLSSQKTWSMVEEKGPSARMNMFASGIHAFVAVVSDRRYVIGRRSTWIPFPLEQIYLALNQAEGSSVWGRFQYHRGLASWGWE